MKMKLILLVALLNTFTGLSTAAESTTPARFLLKGKVAMDDVYVFNVQPNAPGRKSEWLALGAVLDGYTLSAYDHPTDTLTLKKGNETLQVPMDIAAIQDVGTTPSEARQRNRERMARMKPALEAGQPIKGSALVLINGSVAEQPVEFVMGRETRIEVGDAGALLVTPKLNPDGSVAYNISRQTKGADGAPGPVEGFPKVVNTPWAGFTLSVGSNRVFGFQPAEDKP